MIGLAALGKALDKQMDKPGVAGAPERQSQMIGKAGIARHRVQKLDADQLRPVVIASLDIKRRGAAERGTDVCTGTSRRLLKHLRGLGRKTEMRKSIPQKHKRRRIRRSSQPGAQKRKNTEIVPPARRQRPPPQLPVRPYPLIQLSAMR